MFDLRARDWIGRLADPLGRGLARIGLTPTAITVIGVLVTAAGGVLVGTGRLPGGAAMVLAGGALDLLDGAVARAGGSATPRGAVVDSVADRVGETAMWAGLAHHLAGRPVPVTLCVVALGTSFLISYLRSKAEASGLSGRGGLAGRAERIILYVLGVGSGLVVPMLWTMVSLNTLTVGQRFRLLWRQLPA